MMCGTKALEGATRRLEKRPSNVVDEIESTDFSDGVKSWGDWSNAPRLEEDKLPIPAEFH